MSTVESEGIEPIPAPISGVPVWDIDPYSMAVLTDLESWYAGLRERGPLVWLSRYGCWAVGNYDEVRTVFSDWKRFCSSRGVGLSDFATEKPWRPPSIILEKDPPEHTRARKAMMRALSPQAINDLTAPFEASAENLIDKLLTRPQFDAVTDFAEVFPLSVFPDAVGLAQGDRHKLLTYGTMVFNALGPDNELRRAALNAAADVVPWITDRCQRQSLVGSGFGESIYQCADAGDITETEAGMLVRSLLSAGIDTTVAGLGAAIKFFAESPEQWSLLRKEPELARNAFDEVLRLASPVHAFYRTAAVDTDIAGIPVQEGAKVMCVLGAANHDEKRWAEPIHFDIRRKVNGHMALGSGLHSCVGQNVARKEAEVLLSAMARKVSRIESLGPTAWRAGNSLRTLDHGLMRLHA